jgi:hypothetical protein
MAVFDVKQFIQRILYRANSLWLDAMLAIAADLRLLPVVLWCVGEEQRRVKKLTKSVDFQLEKWAQESGDEELSAIADQGRYGKLMAEFVKRESGV